jgi:hypothetical protein
MGTDDENSSVGVDADQYPAIEARRRGEVAKGERVLNLLLDNIFERLAITAPKSSEGG